MGKPHYNHLGPTPPLLVARRVTLVVDFAFLPQNLSGFFCTENTQTLTIVIGGGGSTKTLLSCSSRLDMVVTHKYFVPQLPQ